jgi:branched-chain amino acid transport system permease protein
VVAVALLALVVMPPLMLDKGMLSLATLAASYAIATIALNIIMGFAGLISIGHAAFFAVGAYVTAILQPHIPAGLTIALPLVSGAVTAVVGAVFFGIPAGRLSGHYLGIVTLGFGVALPGLATMFPSLTGGSAGLLVLPAQVGSFVIAGSAAKYMFAAFVAVLGIVATLKLRHSPIGRRFLAVRQSEIAAAAMGIPVWRTKALAFTIGAFLTGVAGSVYAMTQGYVSPDTFDLFLSLLFLAAIVIGGMNSIAGSLIAAVLLVVVQQQGTRLNGLAPAVVGVLIVVSLLLLPGGISTIFARSAAAWRRARGAGGSDA